MNLLEISLGNRKSWKSQGSIASMDRGAAQRSLTPTLPRFTGPVVVNLDPENYTPPG
jgi:hypothetical protein